MTKHPAPKNLLTGVLAACTPLLLFAVAACGGEDGTSGTEDSITTTPTGTGTDTPTGNTSVFPNGTMPTPIPTPGPNPTPVGPESPEPNPEPNAGAAGNPNVDPAGGSPGVMPVDPPEPNPVGDGGSGGTAGGQPNEPEPGPDGTAGMGAGGAPDEEDPEPAGNVDCGPNGIVIEDAGPQSNRVNYVIVGDGYTESELDTTYLEHIEVAMEKRFSDPIGQPYLRYRKFVNICAVRVVSNGGICGNSALGCCGDDGSRLANCNQGAARDAISNNFDSVPDFDVDWNAVVLNGSSWWNTGSQLMLWSGGNNDADGAALHEGGHGFHQLADEYDGTSGNCGEFGEVNSTADAQNTNGKWNLWLGYEQQGATGLQDTFQGSRYCSSSSGQYRPSDNSMMNLLFGNNPDTSFNSVSREKMVFDIWRVVEPIDSVNPPEGSVSGTTVLRVNVVDPEVINVDWSADGSVVEADGGAEFDVSVLGAGTHEVTAFAYDNAGEDLVRYREGGDQYGRMNWERSQQTVSWTVTVP